MERELITTSNVVNLRRLKTDRNLSRYLSFLILNYERIY